MASCRAVGVISCVCQLPQISLLIDYSCLISERNLTLKGVLVAISIFACSQKEMESVDFNAARGKYEHIPTGVTGEVPKLFTCENATETQLRVPRALAYIKPGHPPPPKAMGRGMENPGWEIPGAPGTWLRHKGRHREGAEPCVHPAAALPGAAQAKSRARRRNCFISAPCCPKAQRDW